MRVLQGCLSVCECASFPFGFEGEMWELIVFLVPDYFFTFYKTLNFPQIGLNHDIIPLNKIKIKKTLKS